MTNADYIRTQLNDRQLAEMLSFSSHSNIQNRAMIAFDNWAGSFSSNKGNVKGIDREDPSIWAWEKVYDDCLGQWIDYGRETKLSFQVWLTMPYNERGEWNNG